jgi:ABC-type multidrug transport system fused ATPase/permease subunit
VNSGLAGDLRTIYRLLSVDRRRQLFLVAVLMPFTALAEMAMIAAIVPFVSLLTGGATGTSGGYLLGGLIRRIQDFAPQQPLTGAAVIFAAAVLITAALRLALTHSSQRFAFALGHDLSVELQRRILHQPYLFHIERHSSELLAALGKIDHLIYNLVLQSLQAASAALIGLFVVAVLGSIDPLSTALAALLIGGFYGLTLLLTRRQIESHARVIGDAYDQRLKSMQESLTGIRDVIIDRSQELQIERFRVIDLQSAQARAKAMFLAAAPRFLIECIGLILIAVLAVIIAERSGGITAALPILGALALGALRLLPLASQFYGGWVSLGSSGPILREVVELISLPMPQDPTAAPAPKFAVAIRLDRVRFHYPGRIQPALKNLSLVIPKGCRVAITGKTGSGKSTLADLLMGLIEPDEGTISVDQVELSGKLLAGWRRSIAHVPQTIFLADANIGDNIAMALPEANIDMERVKAAAEVAQLAGFIASLPDGYDTKIGERGVRLSGGQRQRLALARAIYKQAPLLVLDEATSALDDATEAAVLAALDELHGEGRTIVVIAHRMSTVARCDPIFVLDDGQLVQSGSFDELFGPLSKLKQQGEL